MKANYIYICFLLLPCLIFFTSCEEEQGDVIPPGTVENIELIPDFGGFHVSWQNSGDEDYHYVDLSYTDVSGTAWSKKVSSYANSVNIYGLTEAKEYTIELTCYDKSGNSSATQTVNGTCKSPPFIIVAQNLTVNPDFGGINVNWENTTGKQISVQVQYKDNSGAKLKQTTTSNNATDVLYISGLQDKSQVFSITVMDSVGNKGNATDITITPLAENKIAKTNWKVVSFSSEEASGEGPSNGRVIHAIDDNVGSFWHSNWSSGSPTYPHWFIIDMDSPVTISRFECFRRQGSSGGSNKIKFYTSMDGQNWTDLGEQVFNIAVNTGQSYRIASNPTARYFKFEGVAGPNSFTYLGEISVFGSAN